MKWKAYYWIIILFGFRLIYGLCSEFWADDELQIYLLGLKSYTQGSWPYLGPDVVYTQTQIPGALQGLLVSLAFYIAEIPESPHILLGCMSFASLAWLGYYISLRISSIPRWLIMGWVLTLSWTMDFSTRVTNPSFVLVFSIPFFIAVLELLPIYQKKYYSSLLCYFILGIAPLLIMQLHLSFILCLPFWLWIAIYEYRTNGIKGDQWKKIAVFILGITIGGSTLLPTYLFYPQQEVTNNLIFNLGNIKNIGLILVRYLSFASYELPYMMGPHTKDRIEVVKENIWILPSVLVLLPLGMVLVVLYILSFFSKNNQKEWLYIKWITFGMYILIFCSFFFSVKGPSSHTFYIVLPIPVIYSIYCFSYWMEKKKYVLKSLKLIHFLAFIFYTGMLRHNYLHHSMYREKTKALSDAKEQEKLQREHPTLFLNKENVEEALKKKNYKLLFSRRSDWFGKGY